MKQQTVKIHTRKKPIAFFLERKEILKIKDFGNITTKECNKRGLFLSKFLFVFSYIVNEGKTCIRGRFVLRL